MRTVSGTAARLALALTFVACCLASAALAQNREEHFISARAGGVNFVAGRVEYRHESETAWRRLTARHTLESGDVVRTGAGGLVEVLLNPGSYVRLAGDAELQLADASLDNLTLKLLRGSAVVEATGYDKSEVAIACETPQTRAQLVRSGIYRINVLEPNVTEVAVRKGRALVGRPATLVKGGKVARVVGGGAVELAKLVKTRDDLELWSKERADELAEANQRLARRNARSALNAALSGFSFDSDLFRRSSGIWVWTPGAGCYTFLPYYPGWSSPYGTGYYSSIGFYQQPGCGSCPVGLTPVVVNNPGGNGGGLSAPGQNPSYPSPGGSGGLGNAPAPTTSIPREMPSTPIARPDIPTKIGEDGPRERP